MTNIICAIFFVVLSGMAYKFYAQEYGYVRVPMHSDARMKCNGLELLVIFMYTTGLIGIMPVLSIRLAVLEVICVLGILKATEKIELSAPLKIFLIFLIWLVIGIFYTPNFEFGIRMILAFPSRSDGFGLVITEAMECGLPTVAMDCECGPCEIVTENTGIVVPDKNVPAMREALCKLMSSKELRKRMGKAAAEEVTRFYPDAIMPKWRKLFESAL